MVPTSKLDTDHTGKRCEGNEEKGACTAAFAQRQALPELQEQFVKGEVRVKYLTELPCESANPATKRAAEIAAPAAGPAAATSNKSVRFLTRLFSCVMAPKQPTWAFGSRMGAPSLICTFPLEISNQHLLRGGNGRIMRNDPYFCGSVA